MKIQTKGFFQCLHSTDAWSVSLRPGSWYLQYARWKHWKETHTHRVCNKNIKNMSFLKLKYVSSGIPTTIKTMGVNITTIVYLRVLIIEIGSTIVLMVVEAQGKYPLVKVKPRYPLIEVCKYFWNWRISHEIRMIFWNWLSEWGWSWARKSSAQKPQSTEGTHVSLVEWQHRRSADPQSYLHQVQAR